MLSPTVHIDANVPYDLAGAGDEASFVQCARTPARARLEGGSVLEI